MATKVKDVGTTLSPAVAVFQNTLYMAVRRPENNEVNILRYDGRTWVEFGSVPGVHTPSQPALATFQDTLYLAARGEDNHIYLAAFDGVDWHLPQIAPGTGKTLSAPAIVQFGNLLHLIYTSELGYRVLWVSFNPNLKYRTYEVKPGETDLPHVSRAVFGGDPTRFKEIAVLNRIDRIPGTDTYPVSPATCC